MGFELCAYRAPTLYSCALLRTRPFCACTPRYHAHNAHNARTARALACANGVATVAVFLACSQTLAVIGTHTLPERPLSIAAQQTADPASLAFAMGTESGRVYRVVL